MLHLAAAGRERESDRHQPLRRRDHRDRRAPATNVLLVDAENGEAVLHRRVQTCGLRARGRRAFPRRRRVRVRRRRPGATRRPRADGARARDRPVRHRRVPSRVARAGDRELRGRRRPRPATAPLPHDPAPPACSCITRAKRAGERRQLPRRDRRRRRRRAHRRDRADARRHRPSPAPAREPVVPVRHRGRHAVDSARRERRRASADRDGRADARAPARRGAREVGAQLLEVHAARRLGRRAGELSAAELTRAVGLDAAERDRPARARRARERPATSCSGDARLVVHGGGRAYYTSVNGRSHERPPPDPAGRRGATPFARPEVSRARRHGQAARVDRLDRRGLAAASPRDAEVDARAARRSRGRRPGHAARDPRPDDDVPDHLDHGLP